VVVPADLNNKTSLLAAVATLPASGSTPLSETLVDVGRYLAGSSLLGSYTQYNKSTSGATVAASSAPQSPVTTKCDKVFAIVVTDGLPTADANDHHGTAFSTTFGAYIDGDGDYTDDVAAYLFDTDLRPSIEEKQNAITYTVGFSLDSPLLQHIADRGDGEYYSSSDADELAAVLSTAVTDILRRNATLTAANVPASRTLFGDGFYTAYFAPGGRRSLWPGHLQAFRVDETLTVVDAADQPAIDPLTNLFYEPRNPY
jgi:type IV pilus assembly protein PilY1